MNDLVCSCGSDWAGPLVLYPFALHYLRKSNLSACALLIKNPEFLKLR